LGRTLLDAVFTRRVRHQNGIDTRRIGGFTGDADVVSASESGKHTGVVLKNQYTGRKRL
jgi:hypothetical protein